MKKLYVLIDQQYEPNYRAVQAGHAVAQYLLEEGEWQNEFLIYVLSDDLQKDQLKLEKRGLKVIPFREPDVGNKVTAIACYADHRVMRKYELN